MMNEVASNEEPRDERHLISRQEIQISRGPLPPPQILKQYDEIVPGAADRIIQMAEKQSTHRRDIEARVIKGDNLKSILGLIFAFVFAVFGLGIGGYTALKGYPLFGGAVSIFIITSVVGSFIYGTKQKHKKEDR